MIVLTRESVESDAESKKLFTTMCAYEMLANDILDHPTSVKARNLETELQAEIDALQERITNAQIEADEATASQRQRLSELALEIQDEVIKVGDSVTADRVVAKYKKESYSPRYKNVAIELNGNQPLDDELVKRHSTHKPASVSVVVK